jgi:TetR/AcrR family fatty acid metabolism transcriptional regulator
MPRVRTSDKRPDILDAALARFLRYGLKKTTMQEVARDAGVAVGTLYLYFEDKDALVVGCADRFAERHEASIEALLAEKRPADEKLRRYVVERHREWLEVGVTAPHAAELAEAVLRLRPERTLDYAREFEGTVRSLLHEGWTLGLFPHADVGRDAALFTLALTPFFPIAGREHPALPDASGLGAVIDWFFDLWKRGRAQAARSGKERP